MIDIILVADAVLKVHVVVNGRKNILMRDMLRDQLRDVAADKALSLLLVLCGIKDLTEGRIVDEFCDACVLLLFFRHRDPILDRDHHR